MEKKQRSWSNQSGFSLIQLLVVIAITSVVVSFAVIRINQSKKYIDLDNSVRNVVSYLEKARIDSIRRHATTITDMPNVQVLTTTTFRATMDFDGTGTLSSRTLTLDKGITFNIPYDTSVTPSVLAPPNVSFDWRGTDPGGDTFTLTNGTTSTSINVTDGGDVSINNGVTLPTPTIVTINYTQDIKGSAIVTTSSSGCTITTNKSSISLVKNKSTNINVTHSSATGINSVSGATTSNSLTVSPSSQSINGNGNASFSVQAGKRTGYYSVTFSSPCGSKTIGVTITNN